MNVKILMEDGVLEDVALVHWGNNPTDFKVHCWGDVWLVAKLPDNAELTCDNPSVSGLTMGELRKRNSLIVTAVKTGGELRRPRTFKGNPDVYPDARPFSSDGK